MTLINYHVHTYLCDHATGSIDEYIYSAIEKDIHELGFADHAPIPTHLRDGITMDPEETEFYINEIELRQEKYKDRINIKLGFEVDFPLFDTFDQRYFSDKRFDFLIGSCHFIDNWPFDHINYIDEFDKRDINLIYADYYSIIESMVDTGFFDIIGHFDIVKKFGHRADKSFDSLISKISKKMAQSETAAEINTSGLLKPAKEIYPSENIIKNFFNNNVPVTIGSDCHSPELVDYMLARTIEQLKKTGYRKLSCFKKRKRYEINI